MVFRRRLVRNRLVTYLIDQKPLFIYTLMETPDLSPLNPKQDRSIYGWLSFFLLVVGVGAALTVILTFYGFSLSDYDMGVGSFVTYVCATLDILFSLGIAYLAVYTLLAFWKKRPNAVFLGKSYVIVIFLSNTLLLLSGEYEDSGWGSLSQIIKALIWGIIWFVYLTISEQVTDLFPKEERKIFKRDKYIVASLLTIPLFLISVMVLSLLGNVVSPKWEMSLSAGEYTDGTVVFRLPDEYVCEKTDTLGSVYHAFAKGDSIWGTVIGVYDTNSSEEYFKECVDSWRDSELDGYDFSVIDSATGIINRSVMHQQTVRYLTQVPLLWTFAALFNPETGKACIVSLYTVAKEQPKENVDALMNSVRFK